MVEEVVDAFAKTTTTTGTNHAAATTAVTTIVKVGSRPTTATAEDVVDLPAKSAEAATVAEDAAS